MRFDRWQLLGFLSFLALSWLLLSGVFRADF